MAEKPAVERGNPVIPEAPVPSIVRQSMVPEPPIPIPKDQEEIGVLMDAAHSPSPEELIRLDVEMDAKPKGTILIKVFENSPYEVDFSGAITGSEVDMAWKAMMKEYRVWKHNLFKKETEQKSGGV